MSSIGGALLGTSISEFVTMGNRKSITKILEESLKSTFTSDESQIKTLRKKWHNYQGSELDGKFVWAYVPIDLGRTISPGVLIAELTNKAIGSNIYKAVAGVRDNRLLLFSKAENSTEPTVVEIFPYMLEKYHKLYCGLCMTRTWDGNDAIAPTILSETLIRKWNKPGIITDKEVSDYLSQLWKKEFWNMNRNLIDE